MKMRQEDELSRFKRDINLVEYAEAQGYEIDRQESSRSSVVMRNGSHDKIIVATDDKDKHGVYFSVRDDGDHGTIIDFIQRRQGLNLGQVRQALRPWLSESQLIGKRKPATQRPKKPHPSSANRHQVLALYLKSYPAHGRHPYLEEIRGISRSILADQRFNSMVRIDGHGNAIFPHYDHHGLSGYEIKNRGFTGFSKAGEKTVWHSANINTAKKIVITESAIDALSHAELRPTDDTVAYLSIGGGISPAQLGIIKKITVGKVVVIATDNDQVGNQYADQIKLFVPNAQRDTPMKKDWNDDLRADNDRIANMKNEKYLRM